VVVDLIAACLAPEVEDRPASLAEIDAALQRIPHPGPLPEVEGSRDDSEPWRARARRLGDSLCAAARPDPPHPGLTWWSSLPGGLQIPCRDINLGSAGIVLALAALVDVFDDDCHRS